MVEAPSRGFEYDFQIFKIRGIGCQELKTSKNYDYKNKSFLVLELVGKNVKVLKGRFLLYLGVTKLSGTVK